MSLRPSARVGARLLLPAAVALTVGVTVGLAGCSASREASPAGGLGLPIETLPVSPLPDSTPTGPVVTSTTTTTTQPEQGTSSTEPSTTAEPTTTAAPTTTLAPNVEPVAPSPVPIEPVGASNGPATAALQARLTELGFWTGDADGQYGQATSQAVMAFQKYLGLRATGRVDATTAGWIGIMPERAHGTANAGTLVEIDKARQLLFIVQDGKTVWTFNTSTGSERPYEAVNKNDPTKIETGDAVTPNGLYKTTRQRSEGWWDGDLGQIYRPKYFVRGIAIHGMTNVPNYPASHGCVRVSVPGMDFIWDSGLIPLHTTVWVHG
jgi:peptidoglycan hydrolase-like protein with peptidoglycan-binding domain